MLMRLDDERLDGKLKRNADVEILKPSGQFIFSFLLHTNKPDAQTVCFFVSYGNHSSETALAGR